MDITSLRNERCWLLTKRRLEFLNEKEQSRLLDIEKDMEVLQSAEVEAEASRYRELIDRCEKVLAKAK